MEHHPRVSIGLFFIVLGAALLIATNDLLQPRKCQQLFHLGNSNDIHWCAAYCLTFNFTGGLLLIAGGIWFLQDEIFIFTPELLKLLLAGCNCPDWFSFILSSLFKRNK